MSVVARARASRMGIGASSDTFTPKIRRVYTPRRKRHRCILQRSRWVPSGPPSPLSSLPICTISWLRVWSGSWNVRLMPPSRVTSTIVSKEPVRSAAPSMLARWLREDNALNRPDPWAKRHETRCTIRITP